MTTIIKDGSQARREAWAKKNRCTNCLICPSILTKESILMRLACFQSGKVAFFNFIRGIFQGDGQRLELL